MSIKISTEAEKILIELDNGHKQALKKIVSDYGLKGENEAVSFILSVMSEADGNPINNGKGSFVPSENLKKDKKTE